mmetsp:Transcript_5900/g.10531  ORF Transcript_5900/g.10531 Transcript_5900/m.10531 type:complete len:903 (+) Transcript_5900:70-2778(+)|eukprot:CAMPEP_0197631462 /NCGR_PEP_ID=MMETSP1338-20131121/8611_1 /TAXON_ID=43686 ORGANISM="Pelagodinium beii, Strain RCC1491" /NCGR_SAMPLE_ID=MMETSP1338 /ASSEMBLY_ACC=CAM_ASM_000754 /LENGTH=902 /DNA_ID=CAMNT_0043202913 /DNA_START=70 /DNA_END=2778 /DNA_ORIENTATION=+
MQASQAFPDDDRRLARWNLKRAMHSRRIADIEQALKEGEACRLYPMELEQARHSLSEAVKATARDKLDKAMFARDVEAIQFALGPANEAGLHPDKLKAAVRVMEEEKKRDDARAVMHKAMLSMTIESLQQALQDCLHLGLTDSDFELRYLRSTLEAETRKAEEREKLQSAMERKSISDLDAALATAEAAGLPSSELEVPRKALAQELHKADARIVIKDARLGKRPTAEERMTDLRAALNDGKTSGLSKEELEPGKKQLSADEYEAYARKQLRSAIQSGEMRELKRAIQDAKDAGLDKDEIEEGNQAMIHSYIPAARARLKEAVESRDVEALYSAIEHAKGVGLSALACAEANRVIAEEDLKKQARIRLKNVLGSTVINELKAAVNYAEVNRLTEEEIDQPRKQLQSLLRQKAAQECLQTAMETREILELKEAINEAKRATRYAVTPCIPVELMDDAEVALDEEVKSAARVAIQELVTKNLPPPPPGPGEPPPKKRRSFNLNEQAAQRLAAAVAAMDKGTPSPPSSPLAGSRVNTASDGGRRPRRFSTSGLTSGESATRGLSNDGDEYRNRIQPLRAVIAGAEAVELAPSDIEPGRAVLEIAEKKLAACEALAEARLMRSKPAIMAALQQAREADLSHVEMKPTLDVQKEVDLQDQARKRLEDALEAEANPNQIEKLKWAIKYAEEAKIDQDDIDEAKEVLETLEKQKAALEMLQKAADSNNIDILAKAIVKARTDLQEDAIEPFREIFVSVRRQQAYDALAKAVQSRKQKELKAAVRLGQEGEIQDSPEAVECCRTLAEVMVTEALNFPSSHHLKEGIEYADIWYPDFEKLPSARKAFVREERKDVCRQRVKDSVETRDPQVMLDALRAARDAGVEIWELRAAEEILRDLRKNVIFDVVRSQ